MRIAPDSVRPILPRFAAVCAAMTFSLAAQAGARPAAPTIDTRPVPAADPGSTLPEGWQYGAFMEIFVRGYQDSDGDGIGDLRGLTQRLDYLKDLGIKGIWLMPITASDDHDHGYATTDFRRLEPAYGKLADFDRFLKEAHARGIGVIIDYVVNHSARAHPLFAEAARGKQSRYRDWFVWQEQAPAGWDIWGKNPWYPAAGGPAAGAPAAAGTHYFGTFGPHMPDFNLRNPDVVAYHKDSLRFWLNRGLDGFRLDAVPHLIENDARDWNDQPESRKLTGELRALIQGYKRRHVVCEATANPQAYAAPDICGSAFAFGHEHAIVEAARGKPEAIRKVADYFVTAPRGMATMISNHDIFAGERLWDQVGGDLAQYKLAAATYLLQPGTPFIYYGEEIGMAGVKGLEGDAPLRTPMSWSADPDNAGFTRGRPFRPLSPNAATQNAAAESGKPDSILAFYKAMLKLRNTYPSIARGSYEAPFVHGSVMGYQRKFGNENTLVLINYGTTPGFVDVAALPSNAMLAPAYPRSAGLVPIGASGHALIAIQPQSVMVFSVRR
ncbi:MAG TPA: alpha-amylase family glycosyl hydrolase [Paucimonas sp.]|nr:alpha-amylase family glycosyl hydrolase [Paucimonas sp.]